MALLQADSEKEYEKEQDVILTISDSETLDDLHTPLPDSNVIEQNGGAIMKEDMKSAEEMDDKIPTTPTEYAEDEKKSNEIHQVKRMQRVFGLLCMAFKEGPYEFTIATMSEYISGTCDVECSWLKNLDSYIEQLQITELFVLGPTQKRIVQNFIHNTPVFQLWPEYLPGTKKQCPKCFRYGCSKFKCESILRYNFMYDFRIPCSRHYFLD